jgi:predicted anti-sigma-YlaC factor YlaD
MDEHVNQWLGAYLDGELNGEKQGMVKAHLAGCPSCQAELEELQSLSTLLRTVAREDRITPDSRFTAQVALKLPRRQVQPLSDTAVRIAWWLVPTGILGAWVFLQAVMVVSGLTLAAGLASPLSGSLAWVSGLNGQNLATSTVLLLVDGRLGQTVRSLILYLGDGTAVGWNFIVPVVFQAALALLFASWLAVWWFRNYSKRSK